MTLYQRLVLLALFIVSCQPDTTPVNPLNGVWKSLGSGRMMYIEDSNYHLYDLTQVSCLSNRISSIQEFGDALKVEKDTLNITIGIITYQYIRAEQLPELCFFDISPAKKEDPLYNFEVFAATIQEHHAFFDLNGIEWDSIYSVQRNKLTQQSTPLELFEVMETTLALIKDNHGFLEGDDALYASMEEQAEKLSAERGKHKEVESNEMESSIKEYGDFEIAKMVADHYLKEDKTKDSWLMQWGLMENNIGYIQIKAMWLFADLNLKKEAIEQNGYVSAYVDAFHELNEADYIKREAAGVSVLMEQIMKDLQSADQIILDIRFNGGGQDKVALEILRHFNGIDRVVAQEKLRMGNTFSPIQKIELKGLESAFTRPVFLLTSPQTGSAAEAMSLASLEIPHIKRIGSPTAGALSTALEKKLPNGWDFAISNEYYMGLNDQLYENIGVPVDIDMHYAKDRQAFFKSIANDLDKDKQLVLEAVDGLSKKE